VFRGLGEEVLTQISRMVFIVKVLSGERGVGGSGGSLEPPGLFYTGSHRVFLVPFYTRDPTG
jgi:hypothetical protein